MAKTPTIVNKIVEALEDNKGLRIVTIDLRKIENCFCSFFVICHGTSNTHVASLADSVEEKLDGIKEKPIHVEGKDTAQWIILDYGNVVVHVFQKEQRDYYQLEEFWGDAQIIPVESVTNEGQNKTK